MSWSFYALVKSYADASNDLRTAAEVYLENYPQPTEQLSQIRASLAAAEAIITGGSVGTYTDAFSVSMGGHADGTVSQVSINVSKLAPEVAPEPQPQEQAPVTEEPEVAPAKDAA